MAKDGKVTSKQFLEALQVEPKASDDEALYNEQQMLTTKVQEWMQKRVYTSEDAFERLLSSVSRKAQKTLGRYDFQKAICQEITMSLP